MSGGIYLIRDDDGSLVEMTQQQYASEDLLQELLAKYPGVLAGDSPAEGERRRFLLIAREVTVPSELEGAERWCVDNLFLDQDAVPTFVEVKQSSDTRIRREVVGQLLEYAANALSYWPGNRMRERFEARCVAEDQDPGRELQTTFEREEDWDAFWQTADNNLRAGRVRLVFVSDQIPSELQSIVEFLNRQMSPAEVIAIEIRQYLGEGMRTLVPRVLGQTAEAATRTEGTPERWTEERFFRELTARRGEAEVQAARRIYDQGKKLGAEVFWGSGAKSGSFQFGYVRIAGKATFWPISVWTYGTVELQFEYMKNYPGRFRDGELRLEFIRRLNEVPGITVSPEKADLRPGIPLGTLVQGESLQGFLDSLTWSIEAASAVDRVSGGEMKDG